jgi:hypothetical protein
MATGCNELVRCVGENCSDAMDQMACALAECPDEVAAGSSSIEEATALGDCLTPELEMPTNDDCIACAEEFGGTGGGGGAGGGTGGAGGN